MDILSRAPRAQAAPRTHQGWTQGLHPRELSGGTAAVLVSALCVVALALVFLGDLSTNGSSTVGALGVLPVIVAAWFLSRRLTLAIALAALGFRVLAWRVGDVSGLTCLSQAIVVAAVAAAGRAASTTVAQAAVAQALAAQAVHAKVILDSALDAVITMDENGVTRGWSRGAELLFGWADDEVVGQLLVDLIVPLAYREAHNRGLAHFRATGEGPALGSVLAMSAVDRSGRHFPIEIAISAGARVDGRTTFIAFLRDISERRQAEETVANALAEAQAASEAKTEYLSRMSHELRTPLTAIIGFAGLLEMEHPRPEQVVGIETILKAGDHLLAMIDELLEISRIESGRETLSLEPVRLDDVIAECVDLVALTAESRGLSLHRDARDITSESVIADRQRLKQVVLNLLSNAIKYNRANGTVRVSAQSAAGNRLRLSVSDTGRGLSPDLVARLFQPFDRLGAERTEVQGTGLGLALCKRLVEAMAGSIGMETVAGEGSTFWVELPRAAPTEMVADGEPAAVSAAASNGAEAPARTVLYVEDNLANVELVERMFQHRPGIKLMPVMQGGLAIDLAREHHPDVVLLDLHLPDIDGDEVLRCLKDDPRTSRIPVIMLSADATERQGLRLREAGAAAYLTKPIRVRELLRVVDNALVTGSATA